MSPLTLSVQDAILLMVSSPSVSAGNIRIGAFVPFCTFSKKNSLAMILI